MTIGAGLFGFYFFLSLYLQDVKAWSPLHTGLAFLPAGLSTLAGALVGTRLVQVLGPRRQLILGPASPPPGFCGWPPSARRTPMCPMSSSRWSS